MEPSTCSKVELKSILSQKTAHELKLIELMSNVLMYRKFATCSRVRTNAYDRDREIAQISMK